MMSPRMARKRAMGIGWERAADAVLKRVSEDQMGIRLPAMPGWLRLPTCRPLRCIFGATRCVPAALAPGR